MNKKQYKAPSVIKVRLDVQNSVLATCNTSTINQAQDMPTPGAGCGPNMCYNPL